MIELLIEVGYLKNQTMVSKLTGTKKYALRHEMSFYNQNCDPVKLIGGEGCSFMCDETGYIIAIPKTQKVKVELDLLDAIEILTNIYNDREDDERD